jgi:hypothetical protein
MISLSVEPLVLLLMLLPSAQRDDSGTLKTSGVYCISREAIEHMQATAEADSDRVYDILWKRKICDYTQAAVDVRVVEDRQGVKWLKVKLSTTDGPWRRGSKVAVPKDSMVYVRRSEVQR